MTEIHSTRSGTRPTFWALTLFGLAYIGVLVIIFAPEGSLSTQASSQVAQD